MERRLALDPEVVDLYGEHGFDVLCITDHVHAPNDPWAHLGVPADRFDEFVAEIEREAERVASRRQPALQACALDE